MATRAFIGMVKGDEYHHIYCHFDGHVGGVGKILQEHYRTEEKVQALINLGDLHSLGPTLEPAEVVRRFGLEWLFDEEFKSLDEEEKQRLKEEWYSRPFTSSYYRDHGGFLNIQVVKKDKIREIQGLHEFIYLFEDGKWTVYSIRNDTIAPLEKVLLVWDDWVKKGCQGDY